MKTYNLDKPLRIVYHWASARYRIYMGKFHTKRWANHLYKEKFGRNINWDHPRELNEKINWLKFYTDTSIWSKLADKIQVRDYVKDKIGERYLPVLYQVWHNANDIDFETLPNKFVLKTNHGCGQVIIVKNKAQINIDDVKRKCKKWLKIKYGQKTAEPHYLHIAPLVFAEELLDNDNKESSSMVDYKFFCLNGKAYCIEVCSNRKIGESPNICFYDLNWKPRPDMIAGSHAKDKFLDLSKPACLEEMIKIAEKLSKGFPVVRVDLYESKHKPYFGEMTMTPKGGYIDTICKEERIRMGSLIKLPESDYL